MFEKIITQINNFDSIVIFGHINPDGDCYGAEIALRNTLRLSFPHKNVYAVGTGYRAFFDRLGKLDDVSDEIIKNSLAILVDANDISRMEDQRVKEALAWVKIDHHVDTGSFVEGEQVVNEEANSTCELVADLIAGNHLKINQTIAEALYLGILTDTGRFQYIQDFPKTFHQVAWLCEMGADPSALNYILNITDEKSLAFKGFAYSNYQKTPTGVIYLVIAKEHLQKYGLSASRAGNMVNLIGNIAGYPIWVFFCENEDGSNHVEFRSNGPAVQPIALKYGGGGHQLAAGVTIPHFDPDNIKQIISDLDTAIIEYKKGV
ncbi:MAG: bifunctional oligoribonuclease/PAP phosphatase NrnA [Bacilli bacterium]